MDRFVTITKSSSTASVSVSQQTTPDVMEQVDDENCPGLELTPKKVIKSLNTSRNIYVFGKINSNGLKRVQKVSIMHFVKYV